jgi:ParB family chromosome partitioning protein
MDPNETHEAVQLIPIASIRILNPRNRDAKRFAGIVQSIKNLGLKKPIQVSRRGGGENDGDGYDLICGQGRIEAFLALGYREIPAVVVAIAKEERLLRSLVENMARGHPSALSLIREMERLKGAGYSTAEIAQKLDVSETMVNSLLVLSRNGEERLIEAVANEKVPLWVAVDIAKTEGIEAQRSLLKAYEDKQLNYLSLRAVKRLIDQRRLFGKQRGGRQYGARSTKTSADSLVSAYRRESQRQRTLIRKARICETRLTFIVTALERLLNDEGFVTLLRAESLANMPKYVWEKLPEKRRQAA